VENCHSQCHFRPHRHHDIHDLAHYQLHCPESLLPKTQCSCFITHIISRQAAASGTADVDSKYNLQFLHQHLAKIQEQATTKASVFK
jgi:hypothetical protein